MWIIGRTTYKKAIVKVKANVFIFEFLSESYMSLFLLSTSSNNARFELSPATMNRLFCRVNFSYVGIWTYVGNKMQEGNK